MGRRSLQVDTLHGTTIEELVKLKNNHKSKYSRLVLTVITMRYNGYSNAQIIENTGLSNVSIVKHIKQWNSNGLKSIEDNRGGKKPTKLEPQMIDELISVVLQRTPIELGFISHTWTCNLLILYIHQTYGIKISIGTIWTILKQHKLSYKRAQAKPTKADKKEQEAFKKNLKNARFFRVFI